MFAARPTRKTIPITSLHKRELSGWLKQQPKRVGTWVKATDFAATQNQLCLVPNDDGGIARVLLGLGNHQDLWSTASLPGKLPPGRYAFDDQLGDLSTPFALGWALGHYRFERYRKPLDRKVSLVWPEGCDQALVERTAAAATLGRDLINTPAEDLGPAELADEVRRVGKEYGAKVAVTRGDALLKKNLPAIHAVGRAGAAGREPCLIDLTWGSAKAPRLTLVGKGVVFDSGGLDIKSAAGMRLMKKDMGGAATVLALAQMIMDAELPVRLRLLIGAVENAIAGNAYRPGDVVPTRKGLTVEIGNTDAEGRVVLCDCLAVAAEDDPDLVIDFATLTGAARVALGTELPALFCTDDALADSILAAGTAESDPDPLWRMPLHKPYRRFLDSKIADICNIPNQRFGGAIGAALYLQEFTGDHAWVHVDTMAYNNGALPGRPVGGEVFGLRAMYRALVERYGQ